MEKELWKPGNMLYPLPVVMVSCAEGGKNNIITVAWTGTVCTNPPMLSISVRPERYSYGMIARTGEFVINLTTEKLVRACDYCGVKSGRDVDKFKETGLLTQPAAFVGAPLIAESPVNIECRVKDIIKLGSHDMFLAEVLGVHVDRAYQEENGKFDLNRAKPIVYSHGEYYGLGALLGSFGYSVKKSGKQTESSRGFAEKQGKQTESSHNLAEKQGKQAENSHGFVKKQAKQAGNSRSPVQKQEKQKTAGHTGKQHIKQRWNKAKTPPFQGR